MILMSKSLNLTMEMIKIQPKAFEINNFKWFQQRKLKILN